MKDNSKLDPATERVLATIEDDDLFDRYPDRTHFISANDPDHGAMATAALFSGDPVVIVYRDGHELLVIPEHAAGVVGLLFVCAAFLSRIRWRRRGDVLQLPPRARIEARDSAGHSIAA